MQRVVVGREESTKLKRDKICLLIFRLSPPIAISCCTFQVIQNPVQKLYVSGVHADYTQMHLNVSISVHAYSYKSTL